jgi:hypothetical protein
MEWDTLTFPSRITSDDGLSGRSHPVGSEMQAYPPAAALNGNAQSFAHNSVVTDIDGELLNEVLEPVHS